QAYQDFLQRLCLDLDRDFSFESPVVEDQWQSFRLQMVHHSLANGHCLLSLRRQKDLPWNLDDLQKMNWCDQQAKDTLQALLQAKKSLIVVGPTSSGKTTVLNALMNIAHHDRWLILEDTPE